MHMRLEQMHNTRAGSKSLEQMIETVHGNIEVNVIHGNREVQRQQGSLQKIYGNREK